MIEVKLYKNGIIIDGHARVDICRVISGTIQIFARTMQEIDDECWWNERDGKTIIYISDSALNIAIFDKFSEAIPEIKGVFSDQTIDVEFNKINEKLEYDKIDWKNVEYSR